MGMPDPVSCRLRNLYVGQEATFRTRHGTTDLFKIGKRVRQGCILLPCLFNLYAECVLLLSHVWLFATPWTVAHQAHLSMGSQKSDTTEWVNWIELKRLFSSLLYAIRLVSSAYLRLLIFLPIFLIPVCASSSPAFHMMYSAYNLNKQGDNTQLWCTPFLIWNQFVVPCPVLTVASWRAYRFPRRQTGGLVFPSL